MNIRSFKNVINEKGLQIIYLVYMYKQNLAKNKHLLFIHDKKKLNKTKNTLVDFDKTT